MDTLGYSEILTHVHHRCGIHLAVNPGGNEYLSWQSRLETGDWLWITEYAASITPLSRRIVLEASGITLGWHIALSPNDPTADPAVRDPFIWLASVTHETARAHQLPDLIETALRALSRHEQHHIDQDGNHHISAGIIDWSPPAATPATPQPRSPNITSVTHLPLRSGPAHSFAHTAEEKSGEAPDMRTQTPADKYRRAGRSYTPERGTSGPDRTL